MKATVLSEENNIYKVELKFDFIEKIFGHKTQVLEFKKQDHTYRLYPNFNAVVKKDGTLLPYNHKIVVAVNRYGNAF